CPASAPPHIYPLSLHDALPISVPRYLRHRRRVRLRRQPGGEQHLSDADTQPERHLGGREAARRRDRSSPPPQPPLVRVRPLHRADRKSTRLNSSHVAISYAVFC